MSEEPILVEQSRGNVELTATDPRQLPELQRQLAIWCRQKIARVEREVDDAIRSLEAATSANINLKPLQAIRDRSEKRLTFYQKVLAALDAGYVLMPTLQADVFAVRTNRKKPKFQLVKSHVENLRHVRAEALPPGTGRYVSNLPTAEETTTTEERTNYQTGAKETKEVAAYFASGLDEEIEFPLQLARPEIIEATSRAMALQIFDEIAIAPAKWGLSGDPVLMGRIIAPGIPVWTARRISFLIAWHVPTIDI